jgi:hypothetical protein
MLQLDEADRLMLAKLRGVMGISQFEGERAIEAVTAPVYRDNLAQAFVEVTPHNYFHHKYCCAVNDSLSLPSVVVHGALHASALRWSVHSLVVEVYAEACFCTSADTTAAYIVSDGC